IGVLDARLQQHLAVESDAGHCPSLEPGRETPERIRILIDDRHTMTSRFEDLRKGGTHPSAPHDDDVHGGPSLWLVTEMTVHGRLPYLGPTSRPTMLHRA